MPRASVGVRGIGVGFGFGTGEMQMLIHTLRSLASKLWRDDCGAVLTAEYLTLGTVVVLGGVSGLAAMSDSVNGEMREFGNSVRHMRQTYSTRGMQAGTASRSGSAAVDNGGTAPATVNCQNGVCEMASP
jgi:hypothetical protein